MTLDISDNDNDHHNIVYIMLTIFVLLLSS